MLITYKQWLVELVAISILALLGLFLAGMALSITLPSKAPITSSSEPTGYYNVILIPIYSYYDKYKATIDCLIKFESSGNPEAIGDSGRAIGILQFHRPTFERYCVKKYGYRNNIWDSEIQVNCASEMINEGLIYHWSTQKLCQK